MEQEIWPGWPAGAEELQGSLCRLPSTELAHVRHHAQLSVGAELRTQVFTSVPDSPGTLPYEPSAQPSSFL